MSDPVTDPNPYHILLDNMQEHDRRAPCYCVRELKKGDSIEITNVFAYRPREEKEGEE